MKYIALIAALACLASHDAHAQRMRDFSMPESDSLNQPTSNKSQSGNYQQYMNQQGSGDRFNYQRGSNSNMQLPNQPSTQFMAGYCDPNFRPLLANRGNVANLNNCMENQKKQACDMFANLPRDAQRTMDSIIACQYNNANDGGMDENGYVQQGRGMQDCSEGDSIRMNLLRQYWNNQNTAYAIVFLPDMVADGASQCMGGGR